MGTEDGAIRRLLEGTAAAPQAQHLHVSLRNPDGTPTAPMPWESALLTLVDGIRSEIRQLREEVVHAISERPS
jgi:hypothetical protein